MKKIQLDDKIILYKNNSAPEFLNSLENIDNILINKNAWEVSCKSNLLDTDFTLNKNVLYLKSDNFSARSLLAINNSQLEYDKEIYNLKNKINTYTFSFVRDYVENFELNIFGVQDWTICLQKESNDFHNNLDRDGSKNSHTVILALNSNYSGGDFYFENRIGNEPIRMEHGDVLIYPSNNEYRHKESEVTSGVKYSAVGYF